MLPFGPLVEELSLSYHNKDIRQTIRVLLDGNSTEAA